jgi:hypothetical protein
MEKNNLSPVDYPAITKDITAYKTLVQQISQAPKKLRIALLGKKVNTKSRVASRLSTELGVNRKSVFCKKRQNIDKRQAYRREKVAVVHFLKKAPYSTPLPGKKDVTGRGQQKYALNDTMSSLYLKYKDQHPESKISLATFCRQRPQYMKTIQWADRRQCLCVQHQNGKLKLNSIHKNISITRFLQENTAQDITEMLHGLPEKSITFREWKKEEIPYQDTTIKKLRLKQVELTKEQFTEKFQDDFQNLREHVNRMHNQYEEMSRLKRDGLQ